MDEQDFDYEKRRVIAVIYVVVSFAMVIINVLGVLFGLGILHK
jgi:hypothetical protein